MNPTNAPLSFRISSWRQLNDCVSNLSRDIHIKVCQLVNSDVLTGLRISVEHKLWGVLFSCVMNAHGTLVQPGDDGQVHQISDADILAELYKYGFNIVYQAPKGLPGNQISYLMTLKGLGYDKLRVLRVNNGPSDPCHCYIVAFLTESHGDWLNAGYSPSFGEYQSALNDGTAINLSGVSETKSFNWSWLYGWVANIDDILSDCSEVIQ